MRSCRNGSESRGFYVARGAKRALRAAILPTARTSGAATGVSICPFQRLPVEGRPTRAGKPFAVADINPSSASSASSVTKEPRADASLEERVSSTSDANLYAPRVPTERSSASFPTALHATRTLALTIPSRCPDASRSACAPMPPASRIGSRASPPRAKSITDCRRRCAGATSTISGSRISRTSARRLRMLQRRRSRWPSLRCH